MDEGASVVLVHGNPETEAVWDPLLTELGRDDVVRLSPPGFGAPIQPGFGATVTEYRDWLIGELEAFDRPVDLVGHDWGGGHVVNVAMARPDLLRSWASDTVGLFDPGYVWHDLARTWQTPGEGEESVARLLGGTAEQRAERMAGRGMDRRVAEPLAAGQNEEMGRAILALYRSAAQPVMAELGRNLEAAAERPGLSILATGTSFWAPKRSAAAPPRGRGPHRGAGGVGPLVDGARPGEGAAALHAFWSLL
nr:alpha/beta fold hydrolase [Rubrobacter marinus]